MRHFFKNLLHFFLKSSFFRGYSSEPGLMQLQKRGGLLSSYIRIFNFLFWKKLKSSVIGFITNSQFFSLSPMRSGRQRGWVGYSAGLSPETPSSSPALTATGFVLSSPDSKSSTTLVNSQRLCTRPGGILNFVKGAVSRQSSSVCLILPITRPQSLWNLSKQRNYR